MDRAEKKYEESVGVVLSYLSSSSTRTIPKNKIDHNNNALFLLLKSPRGDWNFVKGHREKNETDYETLKREIFEETGINYYDIVTYLGEINYKFMRNGSEVKKEIKFYYANAYTNNVLLSKEHVDYAWLGYHQAKRMLTFYESKLILEKIFKSGLSY
jgi:8-oxo-dGTP pyrophosphatase MutT (NUDIX family)